MLPAAELFLESSCNERILHGLILWLIGVFVLSCHVVLCEFLVRMLDALRSGVVSFLTFSLHASTLLTTEHSFNRRPSHSAEVLVRHQALWYHWIFKLGCSLTAFVLYKLNFILNNSK